MSGLSGVFRGLPSAILMVSAYPPRVWMLPPCTPLKAFHPWLWEGNWGKPKLAAVFGKCETGLRIGRPLRFSPALNGKCRRLPNAAANFILGVGNDNVA